jgi:signal transduction histidine kinase
VTARLAVELFLLAVLITAACAWTALVLVDEAVRRSLDEELRVMLEGAERAVVARRDDVERSLARLEESLLAEPETLERFLTEDPGLSDEAFRWMNRFQLQFLEVLNGEGKILSSGHQPEQIGLQHPAFRDVPEGRPRLLRLDAYDGDRALLLARREKPLGLRTLVLVGGASLDHTLVEQVAGHEGAALVEPRKDGGLRTLASQRATGLGPVELKPLFQVDPPGGPARLRDTRGLPWLADLLPLRTEPDEAEAWLALAVDLGRMEVLRRQLLEAFALLACGVGFLAAVAGVWIARRTARPVRDLVSAFDAIARGEADYDFSIRARDEMQEVVASFSRLHRALEDQRRRAMANERVAAWREVARHVAHEVKNPLAPIRLTVENLLRVRTQAPERFDAMFREGMQTILEEVQQLSRMVNEFAEFARLPLPALRPVALDELVDRVVELYASEPDVTIRKELAPDLPRVELDADQISRALKNVVGNALEASREGRRGEGAEVVIRAGVADGSAQIEVLDNGPGFSQEAEQRLFEPYFTTKRHGVGLGMALTYRIVIEHGGVIFAENRPRAGARVVIRLPLRSAEPDVARSRAEDPA